MKDAAARALAANVHTDPYAADRKAARREAARSPLNGSYVTTAKSPRPGVRFEAKVTPFGVEITPEGETSTFFELMSAFRHDLAKGYIRPCLGREAARERLTARPGTRRRVVFVKRTNGKPRRMRFRYDPERTPPLDDAVARGLLPVWDLDKGAARFVNLDGVLSA